MASDQVFGLGWLNVQMPEEVAETVRAHKVGSKVIRAYRRTDHFQERNTNGTVGAACRWSWKCLRTHKMTVMKSF